MQESNEALLSQPYFIPRHVHLCVIGNQVVFLDLRKDKYLAIGSAQRQALSGRVHGWLRAADDTQLVASVDRQAGDSVVQSMLKLGLLTADPRHGKNAEQPTAETVSEVLVDDDFERRPNIRVAHLAAFLFSCARASLALRLRPLERVVESFRKRKARSLQRGVTVDLEQARQLIAIFDRLRPFVFTSRDACLFDSLAVLEFLALYASYPTWVLGVETQPFGAHSWVQHQGFVFNGTVEYVRRFTPILAI